MENKVGWVAESEALERVEVASERLEEVLKDGLGDLDLAGRLRVVLRLRRAEEKMALVEGILADNLERQGLTEEAARIRGRQEPAGR